MDSNGRNNISVSVPESKSKDVKIEPIGECKNSDVVKENSHAKVKKINSIFENKLKDIQKRKIAARFEIDMDNEDSNDSVKRMRYSDTHNDALLTNNSEDAKQTYTLVLTNSPGEWTSQEVLNFVKNECGVHISRINDSREENTDEDFQIRLRFETKKQLDQVLIKLREKEEQGKLTVNLMHNIKDESESDAESDTTVVLEQINDPKQGKESAGSSKINQDVNSVQSNDYYMRNEYLESLGIKPPITSWVNVTNFRCDKSELKEVLELAGKVLICSVTMATKYANVMYSHPLEAVQAVSMLNGQKYYGQTLKVEISNITENKALLPKGLVDVGPGLGKYGKPILDLPEQYKRFVKGKPSKLEACLFQSSFLKKIGTSVNENVVKFVHDLSNSNSQNETDRERETNESQNEKESAQKDQSSNYAPIGQKPANNIPLLMPQMNQRVNKVSPRPPMQVLPMVGPMAIPNPMPGPMQNPIPISSPIGGPMQSPMHVSNPIAGPMQGPISVSNRMQGPMPVSNPMQGPMQGPIPVSIPITGTIQGQMPVSNPIAGPMQGPMPGSNPIAGPMQGPMLGSNPIAGPIQGPVPVLNPMAGLRGPMHSPVMGLRGPRPTSVGPAQRPGFPMDNQSTMYPNVPPVPSLEPGNDSRNVNGMMTGPRFQGPRGPIPGPMNPMVGPRGPMPGPNRFPGPGPMMGPKPGPMVPHGPIESQNSPLRSNIYFGPNVRMFQGPDPLMVQITNRIIVNRWDEIRKKSQQNH